MNIAKVMIYNEETYHRTEAFLSMGVLEEEMKIIDQIIQFKKKHKFDDTVWDLKKGSLELKMSVSVSGYKENNK